MPWRRNIQQRSVEPSPMLMSHWNNGGTRSFAAAICPTMFLSTCSLWPASMPPIDMIVLRTMSKRSREGARQAAATLSRVTPSYSGQPTRLPLGDDGFNQVFIKLALGQHFHVQLWDLRSSARRKSKKRPHEIGSIDRLF